MKTCKNCQIDLDYVHFYSSATNKDGYMALCKICHKARIKVYDKLYKSKYRAQNKEKLAKRWAKYYIQTREKRLEYQKKYSTLNKQKIIKRSIEYQRIRRKTDTLFNLKYKVRRLVQGAFKRNKTKNFKKHTKTQTLLGCSLFDFYQYMESLFQPGMTFENHGEWHIDHIIPLASAKTQEEVERLCHYTNLQPLWAKENLSKGDKF